MGFLQLQLCYPEREQIHQLTGQYFFERESKYNVIFRDQCGHLAVTSGGLATHPIRYKILGRQRALLSTLVSVKMKGLAFAH
jgi:hypothetical protein